MLSRQLGQERKAVWTGTKQPHPPHRGSSAAFGPVCRWLCWAVIPIGLLGGAPSCGPLQCTDDTFCDDGNPCTEDVCAAGWCQNFAIDCDDGDPCTVDTCGQGGCVHVSQAPCCGNGSCDVGETPGTCPDDCLSPLCGDGSCDEGETSNTCPGDCPSSECGDGTCSIGESCAVCPEDCPCPPCGDLPQCWNTLVLEDFEDCDPGAWIGHCNAWQTWANGGSVSHFFISTEQQTSGTQSLQVAGAGSCWEGSAHRPVTGTHILATAAMRASGEGPIGCHHYQNGFSLHPVAVWSFDMSEGDAPGGLTCSATGGESYVAVEGFEEVVGQWFDVAIELDYGIGVASFWLNSACVFSTSFDTAVSVEQVWLRSGEGRGWFDDVLVCEVESTVCATDADCDAGLICSDGVCTEPVECTTDADCDDGLFCNGSETCVGGVCESGSSPCASTYIISGGAYDTASGDLAAEIQADYGPGAQLAEWNDIVAEYGDSVASIQQFMDALGMSDYNEDGSGGVYWVTYNGTDYWSGERHYHATRQNGNHYDWFLYHDDIQERQMALGSWWGTCPALVKLPVGDSQNGYCNEETDTCEQTPSPCSVEGEACISTAECCDGLICADGLCSAPVECTTDADCDDDDECTEDTCVDGVCVFTPGACAEDTDEDGVPNDDDNCPDVANPDQQDTDGDSYGDACDNCPDTYNLDQADTDADGIGDACDDHWDCEDGLFCNGIETCAESGCTPGEAPCTTGQVCDESSDVCVTVSGSSDTIHSGETVSGSISQPAEVDTYQFTASAGDAVVIQLSEYPTSYLYNPEFVLYGPGGGEPEITVNGDKSAILQDHQLLESGQYTLLVREQGANHSYGYSLSLLIITGPVRSEQDPNGGLLVSGETRSGSIGANADTDAFTFFANAGDTAIIQLSEGPTSYLYNPEFLLYAPGGTVAEVTTNGDKSAILQDYALTASGQYTIVVREQGADYGYGYNLSLLLLPGATTSCRDRDGGSIGSGQSMSGSISSGADTDAFTFAGTSGQTVIIQMSEFPTSYLYTPEFLLCGPGGGVPEATAYGDTSAVLESHRLEETGVYTIVTRERGADYHVPYTLSLTIIP